MEIRIVMDEKQIIKFAWPKIHLCFIDIHCQWLGQFHQVNNFIPKLYNIVWSPLHKSLIQFDQVMDKSFVKELISLKEFPVLQHQAKYNNSKAVRNVVLKVMKSPKPVYMEFLGALEEMGEPWHN